MSGPFDTNTLNAEICAWLPLLVVANVVIWLWSKARGKGKGQ